MRDIREIEERYKRRQESKGKINILKKRYIIILVLAIAFITNPGEDKHKSVLKSRIYEAIHPEVLPGNTDNTYLFESDMLVNQIVDSYVDYSNYFLFSTTDIMWQEHKAVVGIGFFGYVFIPDKVNELLSNYKS